MAVHKHTRTIFIGFHGDILGIGNIRRCIPVGTGIDTELTYRCQTAVRRYGQGVAIFDTDITRSVGFTADDTVCFDTDVLQLGRYLAGVPVGRIAPQVIAAGVIKGDGAVGGFGGIGF